MQVFSVRLSVCACVFVVVRAQSFSIYTVDTTTAPTNRFVFWLLVLLVVSGVRIVLFWLRIQILKLWFRSEIWFRKHGFTFLVVMLNGLRQRFGIDVFCLCMSASYTGIKVHPRPHSSEDPFLAYGADLFFVTRHPRTFAGPSERSPAVRRTVGVQNQHRKSEQRLQLDVAEEHMLRHEVEDQSGRRASQRTGHCAPSAHRRGTARRA